MTVGRSAKTLSLIDKAICLVKEFDPKKQTGDSYAEEATQTEDSHADQVFLKQVSRGQTCGRSMRRHHRSCCPSPAIETAGIQRTCGFDL